jgi:serine protease Do
MKFRIIALSLIIVFVSINLYARPLTSEGRSPFVEVVRNVRESVVNIQVEGTRRITQGNRSLFEEFFREFLPPREFERPFSSMGSGFIFKREGNDVYILTNNHVVEAGKEGTITVTLADKAKLTAEIVGLDADTDLAIIKVVVSNNTEVVIAELGNSDNIEIGEWAIAIGNPFGQLGLQRTVTVGVISAVGRSGLSFGRNSPLFQDYIQTDAAINPGNSGGPLLDINGKVIGVNAAITTTSGGSVGIGFAIPINMAKKVADDFLSEGRVVRAYLGVSPQEISPEISQSFGLREITGILVSRVEKDTPAERGGLEVGDVILEFNNQKISDVARFRIVVANSPLNARIPVRINRNGRERTLNITLTERPEEVTVTAEEETVPERRTYNLGMRLDTLDSVLGRRLNVSADSGLVVLMVTPNSPAAKAGIRHGDVIMEINRTKINTVLDYERAIERAERENQRVILAYVKSRDGNYRFVTLTVDS